MDKLDTFGSWTQGNWCREDSSTMLNSVLNFCFTNTLIPQISSRRKQLVLDGPHLGGPWVLGGRRDLGGIGCIWGADAKISGRCRSTSKPFPSSIYIPKVFPTDFLWFSVRDNGYRLYFGSPKHL